MKKIDVKVLSKSGLHARPASLFVNEAQKFAAEITIEKEGKAANGKSIIGILSMAVAHGDQLTICAEGNDEAEAVLALENLINVQLVHE